MTIKVVGWFKNNQAAEKAIENLHQQGFVEVSISQSGPQPSSPSLLIDSQPEASELWEGAMMGTGGGGAIGCFVGLAVGVNAIFGSNSDPTLSMDTFVTLIASTCIGLLLGAIFGASLLTILINLGSPDPSTRFIKRDHRAVFAVSAIARDEQIEFAKVLMREANAEKIQAYASPNSLEGHPTPFQPTRESLVTLETSDFFR